MEPTMFKPSWWEEFILQAALSFLNVLVGRITNPTEKAALLAAIAFLQRLLAGQMALV